MSLIVAPDALGLVIGWLKSQAEMAALVGDRVSSKLPSTKTFPLMRVSRIGGGEVAGVYHWLHDPLLQVDCFAGRDGETVAFNVARVATALLSQRFNGAVAGGTETAVCSRVTFGGIRQGYDPVDQSIPVATFDVQLRIHPSV